MPEGLWYRYKKALQGMWGYEDELAMKQAAQNYKACVRQLWRSGAVSKDALRQCAEQAGISGAYRRVMVGA
jgi:hypothetical protein